MNIDLKTIYERIDTKNFKNDDDEEWDSIRMLLKNVISNNYKLNEDIKCDNMLCNDDIISYFNDYIKELRIRKIDNVLSDNYSNHTCDYCSANITETHYRCTTCNKDMCELCYTERNEEDAIKNGSKKYTERLIITLKCINEHMITKNRFMIHNEDVDTDECECKKHIHENFGSIYDWIPIVKGPGIDGDHILLICVNLDSPYYNKLCILTSDDHYRNGFTVVEDSFDTFFNNIQILTDNYNKSTFEYGWDKHYNHPLCKYVLDRGNPVYFG